MTTSNDPVEVVLNAYFDFLEGVGDEPTLDHLNPPDRAEAEQLIASLQAGRGIDPEASRPSLAALLDSDPPPVSLGEVADIGAELEAGLRRDIDERCVVAPDLTARAAGIQSDLIITALGHRLRAIVEPSTTDLDSLTPTRVAAASAIFGAFGDVAGVMLITPAPDLVGVVIERSDLQAAVEVPSGRPLPPQVRRPATNAITACAVFVHELAPAFEPLGARVVETMTGDLALPDIEALAHSSITAIAAKGSRARIPEKKTAWSSLGDAEIAAVASIVARIEAGEANPEDLGDWLDELAGPEAA